MEAGIQFHLPTFRTSTLPQLIEIGRAAQSAGIGQIWVTDNLQSRNAFVVLAALASTLKIKLGTAVMVQYFRNPVDVADSAASLSELMDGRELSLGIARGNQYTGRLLDVVKPVSMLRETAQVLSALLAGDRVEMSRFPTVSSYFNFAPGAAVRLAFQPGSPVRLYCGGNGPLALAVGGQTMDGVVFGGTLQAAARAGKLEGLLAVADQAAAQAGRPVPLPKVAEVKISIHPDRRTARDFARHSVASRMLNLRRVGYTPEDYRKLGVDAGSLDRLDEAWKGGVSGEALHLLVTDAMVDALFVAGEPSYCRERMLEVARMAGALGFRQLMFSEIGPDMRDSLRLLSESVLPVL